MKQQNITKNWYSLKRILSYNCAYSIVFGERKNGKTYSAKEQIIECILNGRQFMYVRRLHIMITTRKMRKLFEDIDDLCIKKLGSKILYNGHGEFYIIKDSEQFTVGYCTSIEDAYIDKGIPFNNVQIVLYDEFIDYVYMKNELEMFRHTIANIIRDEDKQNVKIIMLGNTVSKYCPYFEYFGINVNKLRRGDIAVINGKQGGSAAVEYTKTRVTDPSGVKKSRYFGFDGVESDMILYGEWEYNSCNTHDVDGISWNNKRTRINAYITGLENVYEMSYTNGKNPVAFIRSINTQRGLVSDKCEYNLSFDNSLDLVTSKGRIIPKYRKTSEFINPAIIEGLKIINECMKCGRIVYVNEQVGTEFEKAFKGIL